MSNRLLRAGSGPASVTQSVSWGLRFPNRALFRGSLLEAGIVESLPVRWIPTTSYHNRKGFKHARD